MIGSDKGDCIRLTLNYCSCMHGFPNFELLQLHAWVSQTLTIVPSHVYTQLLHGSHGLKPTEPVIDFISRYHTHFLGGVFWVNGMCPELVLGAAECIRSRHVRE